MNTLKRKIEAVMAANGDAGQFAAGRMLAAMSYVYGACVGAKNAAFDMGFLSQKRLPCRVISVGNIVAGGTGKTPMTIYLAALLKQMGHRPAVLSRGYGGKAEKNGVVVSDGHEIFCSPEISGDEPYMMAAKLRGVPVIVGAARYKSGLRAISEFDPDIIVLDDGYQHRKLYRNLDMVLLDAQKMLGNGCLLPRGMLRESVSGLARSDAIVFTRCKGDFTSGMRSKPEVPACAGDTPVFLTDHVSFVSGVHDGEAPFSAQTAYDDGDPDFSVLNNAAVFVFSGISGNPEFLSVIEKNAKSIAGHAAFPDHHGYTVTELEAIVNKAVLSGADFLVTTEKDYVRVAGKIHGDIPVAVVGVRITFIGDDESAFVRFLRQKLASDK